APRSFGAQPAAAFGNLTLPSGVPGSLSRRSRRETLPRCGQEEHAVSQNLTSPPPLALSMVLADHVHRDPASGKFFILGTYNSVLAPAFPRACQPLVIYVALTDGHGRVPLRLVLTDADEELGAICAAEGSAQVDDPTRAWEVVFQLQGVVLPSP